MWEAKKHGVLINIPSYGYWLADEPLPEDALSKPPPTQRHDPKATEYRKAWAGRRKGRQRALTDAQIETLEGWFEEGKKTWKEMAEALGGVSLSTINNYKKAWREKNRDAEVGSAINDSDKVHGGEK